MDDDPPEPSDGLETHPLNPDAVRRPSGSWNEDSLPITEWENPAHRVVLPASLQVSLALPIGPVLRWDTRKLQVVIREHARDQHVIDDLGRYLTAWRFHGVETAEDLAGRRIRTINQRILFQDEHRRWHPVSIGPLLGSDNVITVFGSSKPNFVENRLRWLVDVVERKS